MADEFYIGYEPDVPPAMAARLKRVVPALITLALACAVAALAFHERLPASRFDFGRPRVAEGVLIRRPYPVLDVAGRTVWLVGQGKHGAESTLGSVPDGHVRLHGATIARGRHEMLEIVPGTVDAAAADSTSDGTVPSTRRTPPAPGDDVTLTGEIVDSKCHLGVMNPGEGVVHRDCARLCLRGGIPPMLLVRGDDGQESLVLLVGADGQGLGSEVAHLAGRLVSLPGRLTTGGPIPVLWMSKWRSPNSR